MTRYIFAMIHVKFIRHGDKNRLEAMKRLCLITTFFLSFMAASAVALDTQQIGVVREFVDRTGGAKEKEFHMEATLIMLQLFAADKHLENPLTDQPIKADTDTIWQLWTRTKRLAAAYGLQENQLEVDPAAPTPRQLQTMLDQTASLQGLLETAMVDRHIATQTAGLKTELTKELRKPTTTYVVGGVQREAVTERAVALKKQIDEIEGSRPLLLQSMHQMYRQGRIETVKRVQNCPGRQAESVTDAWLDRQFILHQKQQEAEARKLKQQQTNRRPRERNERKTLRGE